MPLPQGAGWLNMGPCSDVNKATHVKAKAKAKAMGRNYKGKILNLRINGSNGMSVYRAVWPQFANATNRLS